MNTLKRVKKFFGILGPGLITGSSDDDPSGIGTYSQIGAQFGFSQLWTTVFSAPFMTAIQEMCGRIGLVTGTGLAGNIKRFYSKKILYLAVILLVIANIINIGADLGAMAASAQLIFGLPFIFWLSVMTIFMLALEIFLPYKVYAKILKWLCFSLLAYIITMFYVHADFGKVFTSLFIPKIEFSKEYILNIVAILGTTISPYLFFWQTNEEVEEEIGNNKIYDDGIGKPRVSKLDIKDMRIDTFTGMLFSQVIMLAIIVTAGSTLFANGIFNISTPQAAAEALRPFAGDFAYLLFALGIISTGLLAIPILATSASYAINETMNKEVGLSKEFKNAPSFYIFIAIITFIGFLLNFIGINPIQALYITAVANGVLAPPLMIIILVIGNNKNIMGNHVNSKLSNILGWTITAIMTIASVFLLISYLTN